MDKEYKNIDCENCAYQFNCPVMYSYNNAACLTIRKTIDAELKETLMHNNTHYGGTVWQSISAKRS